jgi:hypothetical protein
MCAIAPTLHLDTLSSCQQQEATMPYRTISDLPEAQTDQYTDHKKAPQKAHA